MSAIFSPCRTWRYVLVRETERGVDMRMANEFHEGRPLPIPTVAFIGLNPSTADEVVNDATVRRCIGYADRWGYGRMVMLNVFAYRTRNPRKLAALDFSTAVGPENHIHLMREANAADRVVCAWGTHATRFQRGAAVEIMLRTAGIEPRVLGLTKDGHPKHPLYLRSDLTPVPWEA